MDEDDDRDGTGPVGDADDAGPRPGVGNGGDGSGVGNGGDGSGVGDVGPDGEGRTVTEDTGLSTDADPAGGRPTVLLTNDDGIGTPGFRALYESLSTVARVVAVAPTDDRSAVGRAATVGSTIPVSEHPLGYALDGTPADCVIAGLESLVPEADLVVAGCNKGANLGAYVLGRSGTVSAAVEATFFGVPAIATSLYVRTRGEAFYEYEPDLAEFEVAAGVTRHLVARAPAAGVFGTADYLNVNAPQPEYAAADPVPVEVTEPSTAFDLAATSDGGTITLEDRLWDRMESGDVDDPPGTDRRAVVEGRVSVSPLTAPHTVSRHPGLEELVADYGRE